MYIPPLDSIDAGIDWLTLTSVGGMQTEVLLKLGSALVADRKRDGFAEQPYGAGGYRGFSCGGVRYGSRGDDEAILILSGLEADRNFRMIPHLDRLTRIDIQMTVEMPIAKPAFARLLYEELKDQHDADEYRYNLRLIQGLTGDTLYIGSRRSSTFVRVYDKSKDIDGAEPGQFWRFEAEYKRHKPFAVALRVKQADSKKAAIETLVCSEMQKRGVPLNIQRTIAFDPFRVPRKETTVTNQLAWLRKSVRPLVRRLAIDGYYKEALRALGVEPLAEDDEKE